MSGNTKEVPDIDVLALRAKEMLERVSGPSTSRSTSSTAALRTAVSSTQVRTPDLAGVETETRAGDRIDEELFGTTVLSEVAQSEVAQSESVKSEPVKSGPAETADRIETPVEDPVEVPEPVVENHVLDTAQHDSARHRLSVLASRAKESLRTSQEELARNETIPAIDLIEQEEEKERAEESDRATAELFGSSELAPERSEQDLALEEATGWVSHYDPDAAPMSTLEAAGMAGTGDPSEPSPALEAEAELTRASLVLDVPLSISRQEIDFPALDTSSDETRDEIDIADVDPQIAIFTPPSNDPPAVRDTGDRRPENQFSPIEGSVEERNLAQLPDDQNRTRLLALGSAAAFLVVVVGAFALLFSLGGDDAGTDLAADQSVVAENSDEGPTLDTDDTDLAEVAPAEPEAETEVLAEVEEPQTEPDAEPTGWTQLNNIDDASEFAALAEAGGLEGLLDVSPDAGNEYSVLAPSNTAIADLTPERLDALQNDPDALEAFLSDHLIPGRFTSETLTDVVGQDLITRSGKPILVTEVDGAIVLNGSTRLTPGDDDGSIFVIDEILEAPTVNQILELDNIQFEVMSATITESGRAELDRVVEYLDTTSDAQILIEGHTDTDGEAELNQTLSQERANAVLDYLVANGTDETRLTAIGCGEEDPIVVDGVEDKEASRRIELVIE